jgi:hypothetical protein
MRLNSLGVSLDVKYLDVKINFAEKLVIKRMGNVTDDIDRILGQWARERPDLDTEAMGVFGRIFRLSRLAGDATERAYARFGMEKAGLVARSPDPNDRRGILVRLTPQGHTVADEAVTAGLAEQQRLLTHLPPEKSAQLSALLRDLLNGL